jgi:hypothetical protein
MSVSLLRRPDEVFYPVVSLLSSGEMIRICFLVERCWLTLLVEQVLLERGVRLDASLFGW